MHDKRRFPRIPKVESLALSVVSATNPAGSGERIYCESVNISATGLRVALDEALADDARVEIWLVLLENRQTFQLVGKVTWFELRDEKEITPESNWRYLAGIQLLPVAESDFDRWVAQFIEE